MLSRPDTRRLYGHMSICLLEGLSTAAKRVGSAILDHYNYKTSQCDPSVVRLATLLGVHRTTVLTATEQLCSEEGLFKRVSHGGKSHRTLYIPRWDKMQAIVADWNNRMKTGTAPSGKLKPFSVSPTVAETLLSRSQKRDLDSSDIATRTVRINRPKETGASVPAATGPFGTKTPSSKPAVRSGQYGLLLPIDGGKGQVARTAAERRLNRDMLADSDRYSIIITAITPAIYEGAIAAEMGRPGSGYGHVHAELGSSLLSDRRHE